MRVKRIENDPDFENLDYRELLLKNIE